jgi:rSAM/selenodomain-associated transferase 2
VVAAEPVARLAIVLPTLDEAATIEHTLRTLQPLRQRGALVIVTDASSADGTAARAAPHADRVITAPRGRARQMNAGAAAASHTDALLFLHADTHLPADADTLIHSALQHHAWGRFDVRIAGRSRWLPVVAALMNLRSRLTGIATGDQAIFITRAAFDAAGGFPDQPLMEDVEISRRLKHRVGRPACLRARVVTSGRRWDERGAWRTIVLMWTLRWDYWRGVSAESIAARYR